MHPRGLVSVVDDRLIETPRLELRLVAASDLIRLLRDPEAPDLFVGEPFVNSHRVLVDDPGPLRWRVPQVEADPSLNRWFVRFMVRRVERDVIGSTSFHGAPDADGMVEIGLGVSEAFRNQGYATEALLGMWTWACARSDVRVLRYTVSPANAPSVAIIESFGFEHRGQQIDEIDGLEDIYEMSVDEFRRRHL